MVPEYLVLWIKIDGVRIPCMTTTFAVYVLLTRYRSIKEAIHDMSLSFVNTGL